MDDATRVDPIGRILEAPDCEPHRAADRNALTWAIWWAAANRLPRARITVEGGTARLAEGPR